MKFFAIYMKTDANAPLETVTCISSRFSFMAGIFQGFWALYHRIWWLAALLISIEILLGYARSEQIIATNALAIINMALFAIVGFSASDWQEANLKHKSYTFMDVVIARNDMEAKARFLDQYTSKTQHSSAKMHEAFA